MQYPGTSSGDIAVTAATAVTARPARVMSVTLTPAAALSTMIVYDNPSAASGTVLVRLQAAASGNSAVWQPTYGTPANTGVTVVITGAGAIGTVHYAAE